MDPKARNELVMLVSGLLGIVVGHMLRRSTMSPERRAAARFDRIGVSSLIATPALARTFGDLLQIEQDDERAQASLSFATGAVLTFFAEDVGRYLPGLPGPDKAGEA